MTRRFACLLFSLLLCAGPQSIAHAQDGIKGLSTVRQKPANSAAADSRSSAGKQQDLIKKKREMREETSIKAGSGTYRVFPSCVQK